MATTMTMNEAGIVERVGKLGEGEPLRRPHSPQPPGAVQLEALKTLLK